MTFSGHVFSTLSTEGKWQHIADVMDYIIRGENQLKGAEKAFLMRRRLNPHHPADQVEQETNAFKESWDQQRNKQYVEWLNVKDLYATHRDELANTLDTEKYVEYKNILEKIFTDELDNALRNTLDKKS